MGRGHALLLFEDPNAARSLPEIRNVMMTDNEPLAQYLMDTFIGKLAAFAEAPAASYLPRRKHEVIVTMCFEVILIGINVFGK